MNEATKINRHTSAALVAALRQRNSTMTEADAKLAVGRVFDSLAHLMEDDTPVRVAGFGTFRRKFRAGKTARNPRTGEPIQTQDKHVITFKQTKGS